MSISLSYPNRIDECVISDDNPTDWSTNLPLSNVQNRVLKRVARTLVGIRSTVLKINFPYESREIGVVALANHNLTTSGKVRFIGYSEIDFGGVVRFDSGANFRAYPILYSPEDGTIPFESRNWFLGGVEESQRKSYTALCSYYPPQNQMIRSIKVVIDDTPTISGTSTTSVTIGKGEKTLTTQTGLTFSAGQYVTIYNTGTMGNFIAGTITNYSATTGALSLMVDAIGGTGSFSAWSIINGENFLEIGRIFVGRAIEPRINPSYGDIEQGYVDLSIIQRAIDNTKYFEVKPKMRTLDCRLKYLDKSEAFSGFYDAQREVGLTGELLYTFSKPDYIGDINMSSDKNFYARTFLCNFSELSPISMPFVNGYGTAIKLEEIV